MNEKVLVKNDASLEEVIHKTFKEKCGKYPYHNMNCTLCRYASGEGVPDRDACLCRYAIDIFDGKMKLTDSLLKGEPKPTQPPSWCAKGFWVTDDDCKCSSIYEVIESNAKVAKCRRHSAFSFEYQDFEIPVAKLKPVKFLPYTEEQAERIVRLGMIIRITTPLGNNIIERAERSGGKDGAYDSINAIIVTRLGYVMPNAQHTLIGGIPLGVPKVNEEALQKGSWE